MGSNWLQDLKETPGLQAWRIDGKSSEVSFVPKGNLGVFRSDDCYILLEVSTSTEGEELSNSYKVYHWIGKSSKVENDSELKVQELVSKIPSNSVKIIRESQENESEAFHLLFTFRGGPSYIQPITLKRQINLRDDSYHHKLYWIKGKKFARVVQIDVDASLLNSGDVFVLDANEKLYQWTGKKSNRIEKGRALDLTKRLRDERMNRLKADVILETEGNESDDFWKEMGGKKEVKTFAEGGDDEEFEKRSIIDDVLYCVLPDESAGEGIKIEKITRDDYLHRNMLQHEYSYVIDSGTQIFVWNGSKTTVPIRQEAHVYAQSLQSNKKRPKWVEVCVTANGAEPALFKMKFKGLFEEYIDTPAKFLRRMKSHHKIAKVKEEKVNIDALHHPEKYANEKEEEIGNEKIIHVLNKEDEGYMTKYHVKNKEKNEMDSKENGIFYSGECYICHYALRIPGSVTRHIVYFWQGRRASIESKGSSALLSSQLAKKLGRNAFQVRVIQGKEPNHFLSHFEGFFQVRTGKRLEESSKKMKKNEKSTTADLEDGEYDKDDIIMYQVRGEDRYQVRAVQMRLHASNLCSNDVMMIHKKDDNQLIVWKGKESNSEMLLGYVKTFIHQYYGKGGEGELGEDVDIHLISSLLKVKIVDEGKEDNSFWSLFPDGKTEYSNHSIDFKKLKLMICRRRPVFKVSICDDVTQEDLLPRSVCILDAYHEVFLWASHDSSEEERSMSAKTAMDYIKEAQDGRPSNCPLYHMESKNETHHFTCYFNGWDHTTNDIFIPGNQQEDEEEEKKENKPSPQSINPGTKTRISSSKKLLKKSSTRGRKQSNDSGVESTKKEEDQQEEEEKTGTIGRSRRKVRRNISMAVISVPKEETTKNVNQFNPEGNTWDFDRLKVKPTPEGVDGAHLEAFLSIKEFEEIFKMSMDAFYALPKWKQLVVKKEVKLF